jgi:hypothetical protein
VRTDTVLKVEAMDILLDTLGLVDAERFISMVKRDTFDYTEWQRNLWETQSIDEIHEAATKFEQTHV